MKKINIQSKELRLNIDGYFMGMTGNVMKLIFENPEMLVPLKNAQNSGKQITYMINLFNEAHGVKPNEGILLDTNGNFATFEITKEYSFIERRNYVKVKTKILATVFDFIYTSTGVKIKAPNFHSIPYVKMRIRRRKYKMIRAKKMDLMYRRPLVKPFKIRVDDISAGGMMFSSGKKIGVGKVFAYLFDQEDILIPLTVKILRRKEKPNGDFVYGCQFIGISDAYKDMICQWVFKKQAENSRMGI